MTKFTDPIDQASAVEEQFTQSSIDAVLKQGKQPVLPYKGRCYNCEDELASPLRFCDEECLSDYEYVEQRKRANGRA